MFAGLNFKKVLIAILLLIFSAGLFYGIIWLIFLRADEGVREPLVATVSPLGELPGIGEGAGGTTGGALGVLPGSGETQTGANDDSPFASADEIAGGELTKVESLMEGSVIGANFNSSGFNFLSGEDNKLYHLSSDGEIIELSTEEFPFVENIIWSADGSKVILEYPDGSDVIYDLTKNKKSSLPRGMEEPVFDGQAENIAYKFIGGNEDDNWLVVGDINNTTAEAVEPIGNRGYLVQVNWSPNNQIVALYHRPVGINEEEVYFIGLNNENFRSIRVAGSDFRGLWSPNGSQILYHVINADNNYNPMLWIVDASTDKIGNNNFSLGLSTWIDKCVFAGLSKVYCAVPAGLSEGAGLYPDLVNDSPDVFYEINLINGTSRLVAYPIFSREGETVSTFQVKKLFIADNGEKLYFWDGLTKGLYYMRLK